MSGGKHYTSVHGIAIRVCNTEYSIGTDSSVYHFLVFLLPCTSAHFVVMLVQFFSLIRPVIMGHLRGHLTLKIALEYVA